MPGPNGTAVPSGDSKLTAQEVYEMFKDLGLPICDDGDLIRQKFLEKRPFYLKETSNTTEYIREHGKRGIKNGEAMMNRRPELIDVVYQHFAGLANTAISAAIAAGIRTFTDELYENLYTGQGIKACRADSDLAKKYLERWMSENDFEIGGRIIIPGTIRVFQAESQVGQIELNWDFPAEKCDLVEIEREEETGQSPSRTVPGKAKRERVYRGQETSYIDANVRSCHRYAYHAHAVYLEERGNDTTAKAVCLGEIPGVSVSRKGALPQISWEPISGSVLVFKRKGVAPEINMVGNGPQACGPETELVTHGAASPWDDSNVAEGDVCFYTLLADFGGGLYSQAVTVQAIVPKKPPPPKQLSAAYGLDQEQHVVILNWNPPAGDLALEYLVVRARGDAAPANPAEGQLVAELSDTRLIDHDVQPGQRYSYAVFSRSGDLVSSASATAPALDILAEVTALAAVGGDRTIALEWQTPPNVVDVLIRRGQQPPRDYSDGVQVHLTGSGHARDEDLENLLAYHYLVCCVYRPGKGKEVVTPGRRITAEAFKPPETVSDFKAVPQGLEIICSWTPPAFGQPVVIRSARAPSLVFGERLPLERIDQHGERILAGGAERAIDNQPDVNKPFYSLFVVAGTQAVACQTLPAVVIGDISNLSVSASRDGVSLRWTWPPGVKAAWIVRRQGAPPEGMNDPKAVAKPFSLIEYRNAGDKFIDEIEGHHGRFYYVVYSLAASAAGQFYSLGTSQGCRAEIQWEPWMTLGYRIESPTSGPHLLKDIHLLWTVEKSFTDFAGFSLIASQRGVPEAADDGVELFRWEPKEMTSSGNASDQQAYDAWVSLEPVLRARWSRFYCKLMTIDPAQRHVTLIVHPNITLAYTPQGKVEAELTARPVQGYAKGVPDKVICPYCFDEFPVEEMLFDSYEGGQARKAKYSALDRALKREIAAPKDDHGRVLPVRLCPKNQHRLPWTAGSQTSLIIGLIGAKFSGKSHYIASLIAQLENQVGADMQAALLPVTDETQERYRREFYNPLFKNSLELAMTVGTPPPLIYDLTLDGRQWNEKQHRAVTLALYDTAGENLQDPAVARQMVQYLREASGIIFLVDPLQVPAVREMLPSSIQPPQLDADAAPYQIIANVLQLLERGKVLQANEPISIPVAVVLTKCDVLAETGLIESNRLWSTEKRHVGFYDGQAHDDMSGMMAEYFQRWNREAYNNIRLRFARHAFFGVSATGCASDPQTRRYKFISPWRVEDPLLWLLSEMKVIRKG